MNITNPEIIVINKRYYRSNIISPTSNLNDERCDYSNRNFDEEPCDFDEYTSKFDIHQEGLNFVSNISVASMFYGFIIGKRGDMKKRIELDTKTTVTIPEHGHEGKIVVRGKSYSSVDRALSRIEDIIEHARQCVPFTHFFSVPANNESIKKNFELFKTEVLHNCIGDRGVQENLFQKPFKLHLTLSMLVLGDHLELKNAVDIFHEFMSENHFLFNHPLKVHIKGIEYMNDDPCEVRVLYGKVDKSHDWNKLQTLADKLSDFLLAKRIITQKSNSVTLHMTVLNASFLTDQDLALDTSGDTDNPRSFDCSNIIKRFSDWDFGMVDINEILLSKRYGGASDCYYSSAASFKFGE